MATSRRASALRQCNCCSPTLRQGQLATDRLCGHCQLPGKPRLPRPQVLVHCVLQLAALQHRSYTPHQTTASAAPHPARQSGRVLSEVLSAGHSTWPVRYPSACCCLPRPEGGKLEHLLGLAYNPRHLPLEPFPVLPPLLRRVYVGGRLVVGR